MQHVHAGGMLHEFARVTSRRLLFYCAFGERSAMAVRAAQGAGLGSACHIKGGINAWKKAGGPLGHVNNLSSVIPGPERSEGARNP